MAQQNWTGEFNGVMSRNGGMKMIKWDAIIKDGPAFLSINCENFDVE